jgi:tRNA dimethylallyltransferase
VALLDDAALAAELARVDPPSHARLHPNDRYRRTRALEIYRLAGRPLSELAANQEPDPALGLEFPLFVLERPVKDLDARIVARTDAMLAAGWVEETRGLLRNHPEDCPGLRSIGYAEVVRFLKGDLPGSELAGAIVQATRQYAKRQRTWFRPLERVAAGSPDDRTLRRTLQLAVVQALAER